MTPLSEQSQIRGARNCSRRAIATGNSGASVGADRACRASCAANTSGRDLDDQELEWNDNDPVDVLHGGCAAGCT